MQTRIMQNKDKIMPPKVKMRIMKTKDMQNEV